MAQYKVQRGIYFVARPNGSQRYLATGERGEYAACWFDANRKRHREIAGRKSDAIALYQKRKTEVREGRKFPERLRRREVLFDEVGADFLAYARANKRSASHDAQRMRRLVARWAGRPADAVTSADVDVLKTDLAATLAPATANRHLALGKAAYNLALRSGKVRSNPFRAVRLLAETNERVRYLTDDEEARLLAALPEFIRRLVIVAHETGLRKGALLELRWEDVDLGVGSVTVRRDKGGRILRLPLNSRALEALREVRRWQVQRAREHFRGSREILSPFVFCTPSGGYLHNLERDHWRPAVEGGGLPDFRFHDLRHSFASRLAMAGVDSLAIEQLGGWRTPRMVRRYAHLAPGHLREAVERLVTSRHAGTASGSLSGSSFQPTLA